MRQQKEMNFHDFVWQLKFYANFLASLLFVSASGVFLFSETVILSYSEIGFYAPETFVIVRNAELNTEKY